MTVGELREKLEGHADDKLVAVYAEGGENNAAHITGLDSYEDAVLIATDVELRAV